MNHIILITAWCSEIREKMFNNEAAILVTKSNYEATLNYFIKMYKKLPYRLSKNALLKYLNCIVYSKHSSWKDDVDELLGRMISMGLIEKFIQNRFNQTLLRVKKNLVWYPVLHTHDFS